MKYFLLLMIASIAQAHDLPVSGIDKNQVGVETIEDAAVNGVKAAISLSKDTEYAGSIYSLNGKFYYTLPVSQNKEDGVNYKILVPSGGKLQAIYHTHPNLARSRPDEFSWSDIKTAKDMSLRMFVGVIADECVISYDPATDKAKSSGLHPSTSIKF